MNIAIVAGGTGGHIYPALTLAEALEKEGNKITFFGSNDRMEKDVIPARGFEYVGLDVYTTRGGVFQKVKSLLSIGKAYFDCLKLLNGYDMAIGFGNYISVPVMEAAAKLGLKTVIHEQNSFVGRANHLLDRKMDLIIGSYEENRKQFKNPNVKILGNPQSSKAYDVKKDPEIISDMGLDPKKKTLVIFMGSLGSASVNDKLIGYFNQSDGSYQIIYAAGRAHYEKALRETKKADHIRIYERIDGINVMANSDLLLARAGATTICEICAIGMPAILIPSPFVPNNHQYYNAKALADRDAAILLEEKDLDPSMLNDLVNHVINDEVKCRELSENARKMGNPDVLDDIVKAVMEL